MSDSGPELTIEALVDAHYRLIYRYAFRLTGQAANAEDLVQQTFLTAHRKLDQLRDPSKSASWLMTTCRRLYFRSQQKRRAKPMSHLEATPDPAVMRQLDGPIDGELLQQALSTLPDEQRIPLVMFYFEELSYKEIASAMDVATGTVMSRLSRGKAALAERLVALAPAQDRAWLLGTTPATEDSHDDLQPAGRLP